MAASSRFGTSLRRGVILVLLASTAIGPAACRRRQQEASADQSETLPVVRDDAKGLMFTWIDERGEFHVELDLASVPPTARDYVRVLDPEHPPAGASTVYLVDLTKKMPDGRYAVSAGTRKAFDDVARQRRIAAGAVADSPPPSPPQPSREGPQNAQAEPRAIQPSDLAQGPVVIYGASWCGACKQAEHYLQSKGIAFEHKDIEADRGAALEMRGKLAKAGMRGGSIPVIDVRGKLLVGFSSAQIDAALRETTPQTL